MPSLPKSNRLPPAPLARGLTAAALPAGAQTAPGTSLTQLNTGRGRLVTLDSPITNVFVANEAIADVQVRSPTQIYIFAKAPGETTVHATSKTGRVVYASTVRVGNNIDSIDAMLHLAMPDARIVATPMNGLVLLTGTIQSPGDAAEAERLVQAFVGKDTQIVSRLKTATPLQVNLQVRFAEVTRTFAKTLGVNLASADSSSGFKFGIGQGRVTGPQYTPGGPLGVGVTEGSTGTSVVTTGAQFTTLGMAGRLLGLDLLGAIDLGEDTGQVTTLANPNLTALSGETGTFLAGGEVPIPIAQALGTVSVEYKQYGVSLAYTPTVQSDGRISLRVRPEVSQLDYSNAVTFSGTRVPGVTTRRAETTVELGSGQSFMIGGLLQNTRNNTINKAPFLGDLPILGALFRSNGFQRNETELVIIITPYLVKPVNANDIVLPTDGDRAPNDFERILGGQLSAHSDNARPRPSMVAPDGQPSVGAMAPAPAAPAPSQRRSERPAKALPPQKHDKSKKKSGSASPAPGFGF